jgi:hypothetical protein
MFQNDNFFVFGVGSDETNRRRQSVLFNHPTPIDIEVFAFCVQPSVSD